MFGAHFFYSVSYLGQTLKQLLESQNRSQRQFAADCGIAPGTVRQVVEGRRCSPDNLRVFCEKISISLQERYELLIAHLRDEAIASNLDLSRLVIRYAEGVNVDELNLGPEMNAYLGVIARGAAKEGPVKGPLSDLLAGVADLVLRGEAQEVDMATARSKPIRIKKAE